MTYFSNRQRHAEREEQRIQRAEREESAGKLIEKVPDLTTLNFTIHEARPDGCFGDTQYIRRIVVERAPALFEVSCSYSECEDGGYNLTREVLSALSSRQVRFDGQHSCRGRCRVVDCNRVLRYVATATYREDSQPAARRT